MSATRGTGEHDEVGGEPPIAPVISLAGARAARRRDEKAPDPPTERLSAASSSPGASQPPALTVIEHRRPTADELRALEEQVRLIESAPTSERALLAERGSSRMRGAAVEGGAAVDSGAAGDGGGANHGSTVHESTPASGPHQADTRSARRAENVSMHALTRRGQSRAEVADLLARRELAPDVVEAELDRLAGVGLIDDHALALEIVDRLRTRKKLGPSAVRAELQRRRLGRDAIDAALAALDTDADDELVDELARDRARRLGGLDRTTAERRLVDFLARKGHTGSRAREAARRALDGSGTSGRSGGGRRPVEFH